jgi:hypothetical protein
MTMHLVGPYLSLNGKSRGKKKFRNAAEAASAREQEASWNAMKKRWGVEDQEKKRRYALSAPRLEYNLVSPPGRETATIKSLDTGHVGAVSSKEIPKYSGTEMLGIAVLHKSNAVPVFRKQDAVDISKMRR